MQSIQVQHRRGVVAGELRASARAQDGSGCPAPCSAAGKNRHASALSGSGTRGAVHPFGSLLPGCSPAMAVTVENPTARTSTFEVDGIRLADLLMRRFLANGPLPSGSCRSGRDLEVIEKDIVTFELELEADQGAVMSSARMLQRCLNIGWAPTSAKVAWRRPLRSEHRAKNGEDRLSADPVDDLLADFLAVGVGKP